MKKIVILAVMSAMILTLWGCGKKAESVPVASGEIPTVEISTMKAYAQSEGPTAAEARAQDTNAAGEAQTLFDSGDYKGAFERANSADSTDPAVASILGKAWYLGLGTDINYGRAVTYLETAASGGYQSAAYLLAEAADTGNGLRIDKDDATRRYIKFVALADTVAPEASEYGMCMSYLCECFAKGHGVERNHELALDAANKASNVSNLTPFELMSLADFYNGAAPNHVSNAADATGEYAVETARKINAEKAEELYKRALPGLQMLAEDGNLKAIKLLGDLYLDGKGGVAQDYTKAMETYMMAADEDYAEAQAQVGYMYQNALGVAADYAKAMEWNNRAAQQGNAQGQAQIGYLYQNGLGVTQNLDEAGRWYTRAKEGGSEWAAAMLEQTEATNPHASFEAHA